jgi:hypothetical protein
MKNRHKTYALLLGCGTLGCVAIAIFLNVLVDPFGVHRGFEEGRVISKKMSSGSRIFAAECLRQRDYSTLLLGSSRLQSGIDERSAVFAGKRVLKAGFMASNFYELHHAFRYAVKHSEIDEVYLFVDFYQFNSQMRGAFDFDNSLFNPELSQFDYRCQMLMGWKVTKNSLRLTKDYLQGNELPRISWQQPDSLPVLSDDAQPPLLVGSQMEPREAFRRNVKYYLEASTNYGRYDYSPERVDMFRQVVELAASEGIQLHVAILPIHAIQLETIRVAGLRDDFEQWKRDVVGIVAEVNGAHRDCEFPVWDFTGYRSYPAESIPPSGAGRAMRYYSESSHFKPILGEKVLQRMHAKKSDGKDFGVRLTRRHLEAHLNNIRADRASWLKENGPETEWIQELAQHAGFSPMKIASSHEQSPQTR